MKTIKQIKNLKNKTVLLRGDLDVPLKNGKVEDDFRLKRLLPTIRYLNKKGSKIIIMGHLGRPNGKVVESLSVKPVAEELRRLMHVNKKEIKKFPPEADQPVAERNKEIGNCLPAQSEGIKKLSSNIVPPFVKGDRGIFPYFCITENIYLLENLRFNDGEEKNDLKFAKKLAGLGDIYVNDAFANSHRKHASIVGVAKLLPAYAGLNLAREVEVLRKVMENPKRQEVAILGGVKLETKLPLIEKLAGKFDYVLVGGRLGIEFEKKLRNKEIKKLANNIVLPVDYTGSEKYDIGERTIKLFTGILSKAKTVVWNGPMGKFEDKKYMNGTKVVAEAIIKSTAFAVAGGGDIISALNKLKMADKFDFISTGGGAMLEFLEKGDLVGLKALKF